jgi:hypothetical protein
MRAQLEPAGVPRNAAPIPRPAAAHRDSGRRLDWFEATALLVFAALSLWILGLDLWQVIAHGRVWTGTDGVYIVDQMQYLAWIRAASHHVLASNLFVLRGTPADYFQPGIAISGGLVAAGVAPWLALLLWKPVAVVVSFFGVREVVRRSIPERGSRRAALVLALFFGSFSVIYGSPGVVGDLFLGFLSWGYTFGLLALGTMLLALLAYERARSAPGPTRVRSLVLPGLLGALSSLLHPWQGELLVLIVLATEVLMWRRNRSAPHKVALLAVTVAATGLPLLYYFLLGDVDQSWHLARIASKHAFPGLTIALAVAPLAVIALAAYRERARSFMDLALRAWPIAAVLIYVVSASNVSATPLHAFEGITVPLAILAVQGANRLRIARVAYAPVWGAAAVALVTVPAAAYELHESSKLVVPSSGNPNFIARDEHRALQYLAWSKQPGGVLTRFYLGTVVPAMTGRRTFVGDCLWSQPGCDGRAVIAQKVFDGTLPDDLSLQFVETTGARFVLADCQTTYDVETVLKPITQSVQRFGCATVYELTAPASPSGPLAESGRHAALRASGRHQRGVQSG